MVFVEPGGGRGKEESIIIYLGRGVADYIKVFQDKTLAIIYPLADKTSLNKRLISISVKEMSTTHQNIPLLDIID